MHPTLYVILTWPYLSDDWVRNRHFQLSGWACIALIALLHFLEDQWRVYYVRKHPSKDNTACFLWDQLIHVLCLFIFLPVGLFDANQGWFTEKWPVILCLLIAATNACGILATYLERDVYPATMSDFEERYVAYAERLVLFCCLVFPGTWWWLVLAAGWVAHMAHLRHRHILDYSWFSFYVGGGITMFCGLLARAIWYA
jgi:hypothetical protein